MMLLGMPHCGTTMCNDVAQDIHGDITMGHDVARDAHCGTTMCNDVAQDIHYDITMDNDVAMCTYQGITMDNNIDMNLFCYVLLNQHSINSSTA